MSYLRAGGGGLARGDALGRDDGAHGNGGNGHGGHGRWLLAFVKWRRFGCIRISFGSDRSPSAKISICIESGAVIGGYFLSFRLETGDGLAVLSAFQSLAISPGHRDRAHLSSSGGRNGGDERSQRGIRDVHRTARRRVATRIASNVHACIEIGSIQRDARAQTGKDDIIALVPAGTLVATRGRSAHARLLLPGRVHGLRRRL